MCDEVGDEGAATGDINGYECNSGIPEDHIEMTFDGMSDMITGTESYATRYLSGAIWADQCDNYLVTGTEGFMDGVKNGLTKAWEYIKGLIKKIKEFFFGKGKKEEVKTAPAKVTLVVKHREEAVNREANALAERLDAKLRSFKDQAEVNDRAKAKIIAESKERYEAARKQAKIDEAEKRLADAKAEKQKMIEASTMALINSSGYESSVDRIEKQIQAMVTRAEHFNNIVKDDKEDGPKTDIYPLMQKVIRGTTSGDGSTLVGKLRGPHSASDVKNLFWQVKSHLTAMGTSFFDIESLLETINKKIAVMERTFKNTDDQETKKQLDQYKLVLTESNYFAGSYYNLVNSLKKIMELFDI